jgi:mRNA-degrading endonuclease YafQ of YafQ-DinJ toxin-antitoxin module
MRVVKYANRFRRDYKRERSGRHSNRLDTMLLATVNMLGKDELLPHCYRDHPLGASGMITATGQEFAGYQNPSFRDALQGRTRNP